MRLKRQFKTKKFILYWLSSSIFFLPAKIAFASQSYMPLKIMTFNIRNSDTNDGVNNWNSDRNNRAIALIDKYKPDIFGVQEATNGKYGNEVKDLQNLPDYRWYGVGRNDGRTKGEFEGILFLKNRFNLVDFGQFWISPEPNKPGTTFATKEMEPNWDYLNPRMATWVILYDKINKKKYFILNQHWAVAVSAQPLSAILVRSKIQQLNKGLPSIIIGDLNMTDQAPKATYSLNSGNGYNILLHGKNKEGIQLIDVFRSIVPAHNTKPPHSEMTYHEFHGGKSFYDTEKNPENAQYNYRIDYILITKDFLTDSVKIIRKNFAEKNNLWPSDHYPVFAKLQLK